DAGGNYSFTPTTPFTLAPAEPGPNPLSTCIINFTFDVNNRPADGDTFMSSLAQGAVITGTNGAATGELAGGQGSTRYFIAAAAVGLVTTAQSSGTTPGSTTTDMATVTGPNPPPPGNATPAPTGTVTFQLTRFDPNTRVCSPLQTPVTQIVALQAAGPDTATATTTPVT